MGGLSDPANIRTTSQASTRRKRNDDTNDDPTSASPTSTVSEEQGSRKKTRTSQSTHDDDGVPDEEGRVSATDEEEEDNVVGDEVEADTHFKFSSFFGKRLVFEHVSRTDLSSNATPASHADEHKDEQKELDSLLQSTRGDDSLGMLLKLNRSMSIIAKMKKNSPARQAREVELEQSLVACSYSEKNPGELGRAIIVARYISKRADLVKWLNEKPALHDQRPRLRTLSRIKEGIFLDTYLLDRLFQHLTMPSAWTRDAVKKVGDNIIKHDTILFSEWSIRDKKVYFHVLHVENPDQLAKVVKLERVPVSEDVLQSIKHWRTKTEAARTEIITTFTLTSIEEKKGGLTLTFMHGKDIHQISCDSTTSIKALGVSQWTRLVEEQEQEGKKQEEEEKTQQAPSKADAECDRLRAENDELKTRLQECEEQQMQDKMALTRAETSVLLLRVFSLFESAGQTALDDVVPELRQRAYDFGWADSKEFSLFFQSKMSIMAEQGKDLTEAYRWRDLLDEKINVYLGGATPQWHTKAMRAAGSE